MTNNEKIEQLIISLVANNKNPQSINVCDILIDYISSLSEAEQIELIQRIPEEVGEVHECDSCHHTTLDERLIFDDGMSCELCSSSYHWNHEGQSGYLP
jgi:hypothetical protein